MESVRAQSGYSDVDQTQEPWRYVERLDILRASNFWSTARRRATDLLAVHAGDRLLDVGCGTGNEVLALAELVGPAGQVIGLDSSATMIAEARRRAVGSRLPVAFFAGDAQRLDFPDGGFDGCRVERVLQHLDNPRQALAEMVRVARSGARIVAIEPDHGTETIAEADPAITRRILRWRCGYFRSGTIGRHLPALFKERQLTQITVTLVTMTSTDFAHAVERRLLQKYVARAEAAGAVSPNEGISWLAGLDAANRVGRYRRKLTVFLVGGRKP